MPPDAELAPVAAHLDAGHGRQKGLPRRTDGTGRWSGILGLGPGVVLSAGRTHDLPDLPANDAEICRDFPAQ